MHTTATCRDSFTRGRSKISSIMRHRTFRTSRGFVTTAATTDAPPAATNRSENEIFCSILGLLRIPAKGPVSPFARQQLAVTYTRQRSNTQNPARGCVQDSYMTLYAAHWPAFVIVRRAHVSCRSHRGRHTPSPPEGCVWPWLSRRLPLLAHPCATDAFSTTSTARHAVHSQPALQWQPCA